MTYISAHLCECQSVSSRISIECNFRVRQIRVSRMRLGARSAVRIRIENPSFNRRSSSLHLPFMREGTDRRYKRTSYTIISREKIRAEALRGENCRNAARNCCYPRPRTERHLALNATVRIKVASAASSFTRNLFFRI